MSYRLYRQQGLPGVTCWLLAREELTNGGCKVTEDRILTKEKVSTHRSSLLPLSISPLLSNNLYFTFR